MAYDPRSPVGATRGSQVVPTSYIDRAVIDAPVATYLIDDGGFAVLTFSQPFDDYPGLFMTEVPPVGGAMPDHPAVFRVESWTQDAGQYIGCVVRAWRSLPMPASPTDIPADATLPDVIAALNALGALLSEAPTMEAAAAGTVFTCMAVRRG